MFASLHLALMLGLLGLSALRVERVAAASEDLNAELIADFRFAGHLEENAKRGARADVTNAVIGPAGLELSRGYENAGEGYRATFTVPQLVHGNVSFVVDLKPWDFDNGGGSPSPFQRVTGWLMQVVGAGRNTSDHRNLITAGEGYRWIGFNHAKGYLQLTLNNQDFTRDFTNVVVSTRQWHRLACSLDLQSRAVNVALDGTLLESTTLPPGFVLRVASAPGPNSDRNLTFANYSNGQSFRGTVARLLVFGRALKRDELVALGMPEFPRLINSRRTAAWLFAAFVALLIAGWWVRARRRRGVPRCE